MKMQKAKVTERLAQVGAFAVVRVETVERGLEIADGLVRGGVPAMEISYQRQRRRRDRRRQGKVR